MRRVDIVASVRVCTARYVLQGNRNRVQNVGDRYDLLTNF